EESIGANIIKGTWKECDDYEEAIAGKVIPCLCSKKRSFVYHMGLWDGNVRSIWFAIKHVLEHDSIKSYWIIKTSSANSFTPHQTSRGASSSTYQIPPAFSSTRPAERMQWVLFQVGIFADEILKNDISAVTTAFHSPKQFIFINISVKSDFAKLIAE
ncbi:6156_t:CDS:2, partial [Acaulospora colombiana]